MTATYNDQQNRLQRFLCCLGSKGSDLSKKLRISTDCCCDINTFETLVMYWHVLVCYNPENENNCLTQTEIDTIWDDISCKCGICFSPYGSIYSDSTRSVRITEDNIRRITENGNIRTLE